MGNITLELYSNIHPVVYCPCSPIAGGISVVSYLGSVPVPVTDCTTGVNGTNETQNDYSGRCLIIHVYSSIPLQHFNGRPVLYSLVYSFAAVEAKESVNFLLEKRE